MEQILGLLRDGVGVRVKIDVLSATYLGAALFFAMLFALILSKRIG